MCVKEIAAVCAEEELIDVEEEEQKEELGRKELESGGEERGERGK